VNKRTTATCWQAAVRGMEMEDIETRNSELERAAEATSKAEALPNRSEGS